jgi:uncharacterized protein YqeY
VSALVETIRRRMLEATKAGRGLERNVLRLALGEVQTAEARSGRALGDPEVAAILRKLVKSNEESRAASGREDQKATLTAEIGILESLLPRTLGVDQIVALLEPVAAAIAAAPGEGPATGVAMKHLKAAGHAVEGQDVAAVVKRLRSG